MSERHPPTAEETPTPPRTRAPQATVPEAEAVAAAMALHGVHGLCQSCGQAALTLLAVQTMPGVEKPLLLVCCPQCGAVYTYRMDVLGV